MTKEPIKINLTKKFEKLLRKAPIAVKISFYERLKIFKDNEYNPLLNNHSLTGELLGYRSINVTGDWRVLFSVYESSDKRIIILEAIGTHSQLYE